MAYVLVMGGLALSVSFTLGWALWRLVRVALGWVGGASPSGATKVKPRARKPQPRKPQSKKPQSRKPASKASASKAPAAKAEASRRAPAREPAAKSASEPWALTRWLAANRTFLPLTSLALMLYALGRLVGFGLQHRPAQVPASFGQAVTGLGWAAAILGGLALLALLARWRCRD